MTNILPTAKRLNWKILQKAKFQISSQNKIWQADAYIIRPI